MMFFAIFVTTLFGTTFGRSAWEPYVMNHSGTWNETLNCMYGVMLDCADHTTFMKPIVDCFNEISNNFQKRFYTALSEFVTCLEAEGGKKCISTEYETKAAGILEQNQTVARGGGRRRRRQLPEGCTIKQVQQLWIQCMKPCKKPTAEVLPASHPFRTCYTHTKLFQAVSLEFKECEQKKVNAAKQTEQPQTHKWVNPSNATNFAQLNGTANAGSNIHTNG